MREALSALTTRGRSFLAAGLTTMVCAVALGYDELLRVGALMVLLPLVAAWFLGRHAYRLAMTRTLTPGRVSVGQQAEVRLRLSNEGRAPTGLLLLEEQLPYVLGTRPRFVVDRMGQHWRREVSYTVRSDVRGRFVVGPLRVRVTDPFGIIAMHRAFQSSSPLVVTPKVTPLPSIPLSGAWTGSGDNRPRAFATGSAEDVTVREYRRGDDLRRVHWRSSAHAGELMVRREEQPWQSRATVVLDNRSEVHVGTGPASSLEPAVALTASIVVHLAQRGFVVRLVTASGEEAGGAWHERGGGAADTGPLLESLAVVELAERPTLDMSWQQEAGHAGLLIAVLASADEHDQAAFVRMQHSAATTMAVVLDVAAWSGAAPGPPGGGERGSPALSGDALASWLGATGWNTATAGPGDPLPLVWQDLGLSRRGAGERTPAAAGPGAGVAP